MANKTGSDHKSSRDFRIAICKLRLPSGSRRSLFRRRHYRNDFAGLIKEWSNFAPAQQACIDDQIEPECTFVRFLFDRPKLPNELCLQSFAEAHSQALSLEAQIALSVQLALARSCCKSQVASRKLQIKISARLSSVPHPWPLRSLCRLQ